ncbi:TIGR02206 family membrane protein [Clostridium sp. MB05]|jgi:hypothetical integral membrane protein (TIGR02206 family)|uniref:TMEM164-related integral membrane acyltransferase n=1 Tax=Clostridium sp. MB05 TaxID=3376682 RepID=UPI0039820D4B
MNLLKELFRSNPDRYVFDNFGFIHIVILIITFSGCFIIIKKRRVFKENSILCKKIKNTMIIIMLTQQVILYLWYILSGYNTLSQGLPLYNCRVAIISMAIGLLINNKALKSLGVYWGSFGAIFALVMPGVDPFKFPHYTQISYFVGHICLLWSVTYILVIEDFKFTVTSLKEILIFTNVYHGIVFIIDIVIGANYCYLIESPIRLFMNMPQLLYTFTFMMIFNIAILVNYKVCKSLLYRIYKSDLL